MTGTIPFFYADLIARMVPGAILLAFLRLTALKPPEAWTDFTSGLGSAQGIIVPILYAGMAYTIGTVLEVTSSSRLERHYIHAFVRASRSYPWTYSLQANEDRPHTRSAEDLSRATIGQLIVSPSETESEAVSHIVRFHSEAKMCFALLLIFCAFLVVVIADLCLDDRLIPDIEHGTIWLLFLLLGIPTFWYVTSQRLESRARFVFRAIERLADGGSDTLKNLRNELRAFSVPSNKQG